MGEGHPVRHAVAGDDGPEPVRDRVAGGGTDAAARRVADHDGGVHPEPGEHGVQMGAVERARHLLDEQVVGVLHGEAEIDLHPLGAVDEVAHEARLAAEHSRVGEVRMEGHGGEHDRRPGGPGRGEDRLDPRDVLVHVDEHVVAPLGDPAANVDDEHRRPLAEAEPLAEADAVVVVLLPVELLHSRPTSLHSGSLAAGAWRRPAVRRGERVRREAPAPAGAFAPRGGGHVSSHTLSVRGKPLMSSEVSGASGLSPDCSSREASWRTCWVVCQTVRSSISWRLVVPK